MDNVPQVLIVILNYNGRHLLEKHLSSILKTEYPRYDVAVIDNGSKDGSVEYLQGNHEGILLLENSENLGFGRAYNLAFEKFPGYDFYALINNDMDVEANWLDSLVETSERDAKIAAVGPRILYSRKRDGKFVVNSAAFEFDKHDFSYDRYEGNEDSDEYDRIEEVAAVSGGAVLLRASAVRQVGGFDRRMFLYYEDVDLCLRLRMYGWKIYYDGRVRVFHDCMATTSVVLKGSKRYWMSNLNRIRSIVSRRGFTRGFWEFVRFPVAFWIWKIVHFFTKASYREWSEKRYKIQKFPRP